jgi:hypothetical protein
MEQEAHMANVGDRFLTGSKCETTGFYTFDGYKDGTNQPPPTSEERAFQLDKGKTFPPVNSCDKAAYWKLTRVT